MSSRQSQVTSRQSDVRLAIGWTEAVAAVLFVIPATLRLGAGLPLAVLAAATLIHAGLHQFRADLIVYMLVVVLLVTIEGGRRDRR